MAERTLVLCVDRDDDLGRKVDMKGPIIGRRDNLRAAMALGLADPEDSDTNTLLMSLKIYDETVADGVEVEIATITGDRAVGRISDRELNRQLELVLQDIQPDYTILVTDGAEDSEILPMLYSRTKIERIKTVIVRQAKNLEGWWVMINRLIEDKGARNTVGIPVASFFLLLSFGLFLGRPELGFAFLFLFLGIFFYIKVFRQEETIKTLKDRVSDVFQSGSSRWIVKLILAVVIIYGLLQSISNTTTHIDAGRWDTAALIFVNTLMPTLVGVLIVYFISVDLTEAMKTQRVDPRIMVMMLSGFSVYFIFAAVIHALMLTTHTFVDSWETEPPTTWQMIFFEILGGFLFQVLVFMMNRFLRERGGHIDEAAWRI